LLAPTAPILPPPSVPRSAMPPNSCTAPQAGSYPAWTPAFP
jgi:hypothetical protein